jgi:hypothetical protein
MLTRFCFLLLSGTAQAICGSLNSPITVVLDFDQPYSNLSLAEMEREASSVLKGTGFTFDWKTQASIEPNAEFKSLLVFRMKGRCAMDPFRRLPIPELMDERGPLGMAFVSDGQVLTFGEIECDRVKQSVQRVLPGIPSSNGDRLYGRALGRVAAHEMYHMLAGTRKHSKTGLTQSSLTADELISNRIDLVEPGTLNSRPKK